MLMNITIRYLLPPEHLYYSMIVDEKLALSSILLLL